MFSCHCTSPWLSPDTCTVHAKQKRTHQVLLGIYQPEPVRLATSEEKLEAFEARLCRSCNANTGPGHICTRHPSEPTELPRPYDQ